MAVTSCREIWQGRQARVNERGERTYTRVWRITTDNTHTTSLEVLITSGVPPLYSYYQTDTEYDLGATLRELNPRQDPIDPRVWEVTAEYSSAVEMRRGSFNPFTHAGSAPGTSTASGSAVERNPVLRPVDVSWGALNVRRVLVRDYTTPTPQLITTSAGERFDPPLEVEEPRLSLRISRNQLTYDPNIAFDYVNTINSSLWPTPSALINKAFPAGTVKCQSITGDSMVESGFFFYRVHYEFHIRKDLWSNDGVLIDQGFTEMDDDGERQIIINEDTGQAYPTPQLLDGDGHWLGAGATDENAQYRTFIVYLSKNFNDLGII